MPGRLTLPARLRLRRKRDFDAAYARGRRMSAGFFAVTASVNQSGAPRLGLAVAVRAAGGAGGPHPPSRPPPPQPPPPRHLSPRSLRESFRLHQHEIPAVDLVVSVRPRARDATGQALRESLAALWKKVGEQCATS